MEISNSVAGVRISLEQIKSSLLDSLRAGQILQAKTISASSDGEVRLKIGNAELNARTPVALKADESLRLQVVDTGKTLLLRLLGAPADSQLKAAAMRSALPQQRPLAELLQRLLPLAEAGSARSPIPAIDSSGTEQPLKPDAPPARHSERIRQAISRLLTEHSRLPAEAEIRNRKGPLPATPATRTLAPAATQLSLEKSLPMPQPATTPAAGMPNARPSPLPDDAGMLRAIERLLPARVNTETPVTAEIVRRAIETSGIFFEPLLARGSVPDSDSKRGLIELLLRLRQHLPAPASASASPAAGGERAGERLALLTELIAQVEGGLARVVLNQLASLPQDEPAQQLWQLDIPVRQPNGEETVRLQIERESAANPREEAGERWKVTIDFDIDPIGPVRARLTLTGEEISSRFTAQLAATAERIEGSMHLLESALLRAGFKVVNLSATHGEIDQRVQSAYTLVDEHA